MNSTPNSIKDLLAAVNDAKKRHLEKREQYSQAVQDYVYEDDPAGFRRNQARNVC